MIEIMLALVIIGLISTLSAGKIHSIMIQQRVARAGQALRMDLEAAFAIAARDRKPIRIVWDGTKMQMDVEDRSGNTYFRRSPFGKDYGFTSTNVTFSRSPLEIYPNGLANDTLNISVVVETSKRTIRMTRGGMVQVQ